MLFIGLTGSIATGKSTVSSILSAPPYSLPVIDADVLARKVVEPGTKGYAAIVKYFLPTTPDLLVPASEDMPEDGPEGKGRPLDRAALGRRIFGASEERVRDRGVLNGIVHPAVRGEMYRAILASYLKGHWAVVLDVPLLFEAGMDRICGVVMVVGVSDPEIQMKRLMERDKHLSKEDAENRVKSQGDVRVKLKRCAARGPGNGIVVLNDGNKDELRERIASAVGELEGANPRWWAWVLLACPPLALVCGAWRYWQNGKINERWRAQEKDALAKL
ncbi:probable dephospho-CoA kinase [Cephalotrichum gorgonifer]|uniref:Probable dephospho-CoA kinase n=1 Tax=Cephalotrichum gorgonifer TaxID=2041049 RepID=A0AAE8N0J0_9PEZI|nr:probable dephospho-CoA kinase [Cephalotrichum gorgonifer]